MIELFVLFYTEIIISSDLTVSAYLVVVHFRVFFFPYFFSLINMFINNIQNEENIVTQTFSLI